MYKKIVLICFFFLSFPTVCFADSFIEEKSHDFFSFHNAHKAPSVSFKVRHRFGILIPNNTGLWRNDNEYIVKKTFVPLNNSEEQNYKWCVYPEQDNDVISTPYTIIQIEYNHQPMLTHNFEEGQSWFSFSRNGTDTTSYSQTQAGMPYPKQWTCYSADILWSPEKNGYVRIRENQKLIMDYHGATLQPSVPTQTFTTFSLGLIRKNMLEHRASNIPGQNIWFTIQD